MSESDPTGYRDSPETTNGPVAPGAEQTGTEQTGTEQTGDGGPEDGATLTTDDDAQNDDGVVRPGNESD